MGFLLSFIKIKDYPQHRQVCLTVPLFFTAMGAEALSRLTPEKSELLPAFIQKWEQTVYKSVYGKALNYIYHLLSIV